MLETPKNSYCTVEEPFEMDALIYAQEDVPINIAERCSD